MMDSKVMEMLRDLTGYSDSFTPDERAVMKSIAALKTFEENADQFRVAPDTTGVDYFFIRSFITWDMWIEFWMIADAFLKNCYSEISTFADLGWNCRTDFHGLSVEEQGQQRILNLMLNGARYGNTYCRELLKNLYKTYYKREYNQLKRFQPLRLKDIYNLVDIDAENDWEDTARILVMSELFNIQQEEKCAVLYQFLNKERAAWEEEEAEEELRFTVELRQECKDQLEQWEFEERKKPKQRQLKPFRECHRFVANCFRHQGQPEDFLWTSTGEQPMDRWKMLETLMVLKKTYPKHEFTYEEVQQSSLIIQLTEALTTLASTYDATIISMLGLHRHEFSGEYQGHVYFKPETVAQASSQKKHTPQATKEKPVITNVAPVVTTHATESDYLEEIGTLRRKLHEAEQKNRELRDQIQTANRERKEVIAQNEQYQKDRDELIALREHVYQEAQELPAVSATDLKEMQEAVAPHSLLIVGGHVNWQNKLKAISPNWRCIDIHHYHNVDVRVAEGVERVYFFTDYLSHLTYQKMIRVVREKGLSFGYVANVNIESFIRQVYKDLVDEAD